MTDPREKLSATQVRHASLVAGTGRHQMWALPEQPFEQRWHFDVWVAHDEASRGAGVLGHRGSRRQPLLHLHTRRPLTGTPRPESGPYQDLDPLLIHVPFR